MKCIELLIIVRRKSGCNNWIFWKRPFNFKPKFLVDIYSNS